MKKTYLYTAIVTALFVTNISTVNAETANIQLKVDLKKEIKSNIPNAQTPMIKIPKTNLSNVIEHVPDGVEDAAQAQGARDKAIADQSDLTPGLDTGSSLRDPNTGGNLSVGSSSRLKDPRYGNSMSGGRPSVATDPRTGKSLMGGSNGNSSTSNRDGARAAASAGRGMASDDSNDENVTNDTKVYGNITYLQARIAGIKSSDGRKTSTAKIVDTPNKTVRIDTGTGTGLKGSEWVTVRVKKTDKDGNVTYESTTYEDGKKLPKTVISNKPAPNGSYSGGTSRPLTQAEKQKAKDQKLLLQGRESHDDSGSNDSTTNNGRGNLTDLDLAGQPRPDDDGVSESANVGNIQDSGLLMSGQPTEEDDNFGTVGGRFSGSGIGNKNISDKLKQNTVSGVNQDIDVPKGGK